MIPKIIHHLWIGPKKAPLDMIMSWKKYYPDFEFMFWDEEKLKQEFPNGLKNQKQFNENWEWCGKCDIARYEILYKHGGIFSDADATCLRRLEDRFFEENQAFGCYENEFTRGQLVAVGFQATEPGLPLYEKIIEHIGTLEGDKLCSNDKKTLTTWQTTGPMLFTKAIFGLKADYFTIYPSHYFIPTHCSGYVYKGKFQPYVTQHWGSTPNSQFQYKE